MVGLSSFLALVVGAVLWWVLADEPYVAPTPPRDAASIQPAEAASVLASLERAIAEQRPADAATLAGADSRTGRLLAALVANARDIPLTDVDLRYVDEIAGQQDPGEWSATVETSWRVSGADARAATTGVRFDFASVDGDVVIVGVGGAGGTTPVWMSSRLDVRRAGDVVVMAASGAERYLDLARQAVVVVRRVLPAWDGSLVVEVPRTASGVDDALEVDRGTFANVAGVTASVDGANGASAPVHVLLNPDQMRQLRPVGAQVVVSHEAVHVATNAPASELPTWLTEGFADYVALRDVDLPLTTTAAQVIDQVRSSGAPRALPDDADFDEQSEEFGAAYEAAWLACRLIAREVGEQTLVRLYRQAGSEGQMNSALRQTTGLTTKSFTRTWRQLLLSLAEGAAAPERPAARSD